MKYIIIVILLCFQVFHSPLCSIFKFCFIPEITTVFCTELQSKCSAYHENNNLFTCYIVCITTVVITNQCVIIWQFVWLSSSNSFASLSAFFRHLLYSQIKTDLKEGKYVFFWWYVAYTNLICSSNCIIILQVYMWEW